MLYMKIKTTGGGGGNRTRVLKGSTKSYYMLSLISGLFHEGSKRRAPP